MIMLHSSSTLNFVIIIICFAKKNIILILKHNKLVGIYKQQKKKTKKTF